MDSSSSDKREIALKIKSEFTANLPQANVIKAVLYPCSDVKSTEELKAYWEDFQLYEELKSELLLTVFCTGTHLKSTLRGVYQYFNFFCFEYYLSLRAVLQQYEHNKDTARALGCALVRLFDELRRLEDYRVHAAALDPDKIVVAMPQAGIRGEVRFKLGRPAAVLHKPNADRRTADDEAALKQTLGWLLLVIANPSELSKSKSTQRQQPSNEQWSAGFKLAVDLMAANSTLSLDEIIQHPEFQENFQVDWKIRKTNSSHDSSTVEGREVTFLVSDVRYYNLGQGISQSMATIVLNSKEQISDYKEKSCPEPDSEIKGWAGKLMNKEKQSGRNIVSDTHFLTNDPKAITYPWLLNTAACHLFNYYLENKNLTTKSTEFLLKSCQLFSRALQECNQLAHMPLMQNQHLVIELHSLTKTVEKLHARAMMLWSTLQPHSTLREASITSIRNCLHLNEEGLIDSQHRLVMADLALYFAENYSETLQKVSNTELQHYCQVISGGYSASAQSLHNYLTGGASRPPGLE